MKLPTVRKTLLLVLVCISSLLSAQQTKVYFGLGGIYNSFQDARFTDLRYNKFSFKPELGFKRVSNVDYWNANASIFDLQNTFPNHDTIKINTLSYNIRLGYLRIIVPSFYLGADWDVIDYWKRQTSLLGNGTDAYKLSSDIYLSAKYLYSISEVWSFDFGLDYGMLTFINTEPSFSANFPQNIIDNGEVTFIDSETKSPWKLKNMTTKGFWDQVNIRTNIELNFKKRLSMSYTWDLRSYSDTKGYPVTNATHSLMLRYHFISRTKSKRS